MFWYILDSSEYPQHMFLWRTNENYPSIIIKYPPCLFHWKLTMKRILPTADC